MKKKTVMLLVTILTLGLSAGCGKAASGPASSQGVSSESAAQETNSSVSASEGAIDLESLKTLGDAFALPGKDEDIEQRATTEDKYIYVFSVGGVPYRVSADLPADVSKKLFALEFDEDYEKNEAELVSGLEIKTRENLNEQILPQSELDALVGKTGKELFDAGWRGGSFYNTETLEVWLEYGPFAYKMHFDGKIPPEEAEDFDVYEDLADKKVLDAAFEGLGDASYME